MPLLRRRIRCHFCNQQSRETVAHIPRTYLCPQCDAVNYFDERGNVTDPPTEDIAAAPAAAFHYATALPRSSSPVMPLPPEPESLFCRACERNQLLLNKTLAEYLPDEDDPEYDKYTSSLDAYRRELEDRYPQVCQDCLPRVQDQIRAAGYAAKADNLRRIIDRSREHSRTVQTSRQTWTLRLIALAKCIYICSVVSGLLWHTMGLTMAAQDDTDALEHVTWGTCLAMAFSVHRAHQRCVMSPFALSLLQASLLADWATIWWNPKLANKTNSITGRMQGLKLLWAVRAMVLTLRTAAFFYWKMMPTSPSNLASFHYTNMALLSAMTLSFTLTWKLVHIVYTPVALPEDTYIPSAPNTPQRPKSSYKPAHPQTSTFDTMAQGFTSSFQADSSSALPPSPTLTEASTTTSHYTEYTTPGRRSVYQDDSMDWTPTTRRFAAEAPDILPPQFGSRSPNPTAPALTRQQEPVSLFAKPDPNPFRHKVPPAPKAPLHRAADPWRRAAWAPPLQETTPNFFKTQRTTRSQSRAAQDPDRVPAAERPFSAAELAELAELDAGSGSGGRNGLEGLGVPRNVKRDAELFATPKFKYDYHGYGSRGDRTETGLEGAFNGLFSK
ncbi:hypothetical protein B5807_03817 [Epicoccum nigrum]|uniref:Ima1 N-terminal domain-containing protein n=1 Tax=Epicoccum nigrum TaxID=105696 RepID=A0A1Y2M6A4_EPING|nr:hypothetical protein B5807_03817 [Epicoccum nigrum]